MAKEPKKDAKNKATKPAAEEQKTDTELTKFPNADKANEEMHTQAGGLPSAFDLFKPSKRALQSNLTGFMVLLVLPLLLALIGQGPHLFDGSSVKGLNFDDNPLGIFAVIGGIFGLLASPGVVIMQLQAIKGEVISWQDAFKEGLKHFWPFLGLAILTGLMLFAAALAFIIPFFILLPRVILAPYYLIDRNMGIVESLKASMADYKRFKGVWGLLGVILLISLPGIVPIVGWLLANILAIMYCVAPAIRYEQIKNLANGKAPQTPIEQPATTA